MFGKAPLTSREVMMRSTGSMWAMVSWRKMASCGDRPGMAPQRLALLDLRALFESWVRLGRGRCWWWEGG